MSKSVKRPNGWVWWPAWAFISLLWFGAYHFDMIDWFSVKLGIGTGCVLAAWSVDMAIRAGRFKDL